MLDTTQPNGDKKTPKTKNGYILEIFYLQNRFDLNATKKEKTQLESKLNCSVGNNNNNNKYKQNEFYF